LPNGNTSQEEHHSLEAGVEEKIIKLPLCKNQQRNKKPLYVSLQVATKKKIMTT
jgi:hypothetical protein